MAHYAVLRPTSMTLIPLAVSLFSIPFVRASSCNETTIHTLDLSDCPSCNTRSLWQIILSCALTLFACTWTAVHPNIPGIKEEKVAITSRRLFIMVMGLIAPELMITWAARQFFGAFITAKIVNSWARLRNSDRSSVGDMIFRFIFLAKDLRSRENSAGQAEGFKFTGQLHALQR